MNIDKIVKEFDSTKKLKEKNICLIYTNSTTKRHLIEFVQAKPNRKLALYILDDAVKKRKANPKFELNDLMFACYLVAIHKNPEDVLKIWNAKHIDFDTGCGFDEQLLVGAGVENTINFLKESDSKYFKDILKYIYTEDQEDIQFMEDYYKEIPWFV